ncbi:unnamed protein product [Caenorhabditis auriculariae]|uniref:Nondiscriminating glutamyl-tRNA synthetase EARS2, mitochondrial n=1 Tax=Caenorhabditis auriculariae TaxID=2777116 RepID=A0A8S1HAQ9_9PELO|nr:unnamed protein product [Caenorhabditis auriculariae]
MSRGFSRGNTIYFASIQFSKRSFTSSREEPVRVRFAPSPTGNLHLGGLRTALYNYLFAKKHGGTFILRIEDTDQNRLVPEARNSIYEALYAHGLKPDEGPREGGDFGPYEQSKRRDLYSEAASQLLESGHAYRCFCSSDRLELLRKDASRRGQVPKYDRRCLGLDPSTSKAMASDGVAHVIRFKLDQQDVSFKDAVFGDQTQTIDESDMILLKSDGFPTYHLANIVDDHAMNISHVIRGLEWLSSTGKHQKLYKAFAWKEPTFLHLPLIMKTNEKKLSKRDKDGYANWYIDVLGVLPIATLNLLIRNGSGFKDFKPENLYSIEEMIENFDASLIGRRNLLLDPHVLDKYSRQAFQQADFETVLYPEIVKRLGKNTNPELLTKEYVGKVVNFLKQNEEGFGFLSDLSTGKFRWFFTLPTSADQILTSFSANDLAPILASLKDPEIWHNDGFKRLAEKFGLQLSRFLGLVRISLIDSKQGPPISELVQFFGVEECVKRISVMERLVEKNK